jgi:hypothetical protein
MSQTTRIGSHKTSVFTDTDGFTKVIYHSTPVVKFNHAKIILNHGGYKTITTKLRMNQTSNQFNLGFRVYQKDFDWFVQLLPFNNGNKPIPFDSRELIINRK